MRSAGTPNRCSESYAHSLIEVSLDPLMTISAEGKITEVNEASVRVTGRSREELLGTDFAIYCTDPDTARAAYRRVLAEGFVKDYPLAIRHACGAVTDVIYNASLYRDDHGRPLGIFAAARDISELKHAEAQLSRLAAIVASSDDAIYAEDFNGIITAWNAGAESLFGYTEDEIIGTSIMRLIPPERHDEERRLLERIGRGESVKHFETVRISKAGRQIDVWVTASAIRNADGRIIGMAKVTRDITERKRAEAEIRALNTDLEHRIRERTLALAESDDRLRLATEAAGIGIWDWDVTSDAIRWDKLMFEIYGMPQTRDWLIHFEDWTRHVHPDDVAAQEASLRRTTEKGGWNRREFRIIRESDRTVRTIRASDAAIAGDDGKTRRVVGINLDVTETVQMMEKIRGLNASLESRAAELEASVKELDAFSYSVSHDLRAPLRAIDGFSRIVKEEYAPKLDDEGRRLVDVIRAEAVRMGRLIDSLLAFSRMGRQRGEPATIDMGAMARQVYDELVALEPDRTITLDLHPIPSAVGTEAMIRQLWINLIGNAVKFTGQREAARIEIGVMPKESGDQAYFVRDNGAGFDMRYADKLFGVFSRLHDADEFPGTGVGLALVHRIVTRHGGRVWAEGEVGKGATFFFTLPAPGIHTTQPPSPSPCTGQLR